MKNDNVAGWLHLFRVAGLWVLLAAAAVVSCSPVENCYAGCVSGIVEYEVSE